jgi:predicted MFS family arabinose efflux permease
MPNQPLSRARAIEITVILLAIGTFNIIDRNMPYMLMEAIKTDLALSDKQVGLLVGIAFAVVYTVLGVPFGRLADRGYSRPLVATALAFWSVATALGGFAQNFTQMALARVGVAAGEAASAPSAHSIVNEHFPPEKRGTMLALVSVGAPLGMMIGLMLGGYLMESIGWRWALISVGIPGLMLAGLAAWRLPSSKLGAVDLEQPRDLWRDMKFLFSKPSFVWTVIASSFYSCAGYGMTAFLPSFFMRTHGLAPSQVGLWLGLATGLGGLASLPLAGWLADRLAKRTISWRLWISAGLMALSAPFFAAAMFAENWMLAMALVAVPQMLTLSYLGPTFSAVHAVVPPNLRATTSSVLLGVLTLFGATLGPLLIGAISDELGKGALGTALLVVPVVLVLASFCYLIAARYLPQDEYDPG